MKKPHWIRRDHLFKADEFVCSVCGASYPRARQRCPACGAVLDRTKYDPVWADEAELMSAVLDDDW